MDEVKSGRAWRKWTVLTRRRWRSSRWLQVLAILGFWQAGELTVRAARLPVPGAVLGLFLLLGALAWNRCSVFSLRRGAKWFFAQILLFLMPSVLSLLDHRELLGVVGLKVLVTIAVGTLLVMVVTALAVEMAYRWMAREQSHV